MSSHDNSPSPEPLDLSKWRSVPTILMVVGGIGVVAGFFIDSRQFAFSWLLAFMFFLSLCLGGLGYTMLHHLFDAAWSVPIRRVMEQMGCLLPWMLPLWIPIGCLAPKLYKWMARLDAGHADLSTKAKFPLFTLPGFYIVSVLCLLVWVFLPLMLRYWSLRQDETGSVECTRKMRQYSAFGIFLFGFSLTLGAIMWVKALEHEWFSTMYGVYYFASSMWVGMATIYIIVLLLKRQGPLKGYVHEKTFYFMGSILFAFTVFYAYVTFAQYFIIWNANMPEETFWYVLREKGTWWGIGQIIIFGHFFVPFLLLLRIDWKLKLAVMGPLFIWVWLMHFVDMSFNIIPVLHGDNFHLDWMDLACMAFIGGFLANRFIKQLNSHPILPQKDPRFAESQDIYVPQPDTYVEAATVTGIDSKRGGGH
jgi:hypothetical protein